MYKIKRLKEERKGFSTILIAVIIVVVIAIAGIVVMGPGVLGEKKIATAYATIYVENENGNISSAKVSLDSLTFQEGMMLDFTHSVRQASFAPTLDYIATATNPIWPNSIYTIWAIVTYQVTGTNIASVTSTQATFTGTAGIDVTTAGVPSHTSGGNQILIPNIPSIYTSTGYASSVIVNQTTGLSLNTPITLSQASGSNGANGKFSMYATPSQKAVPLCGWQVDGAVIDINFMVKSLDNGGGPKIAYTSAHFIIDVNSWATSSLSVAVTGVSGSGF